MGRFRPVLGTLWGTWGSAPHAEFEAIADKENAKAASDPSLKRLDRLLAPYAVEITLDARSGNGSVSAEREVSVHRRRNLSFLKTRPAEEKRFRGH